MKEVVKKTYLFKYTEFIEKLGIKGFIEEVNIPKNGTVEVIMREELGEEKL